MAEMKRNLNLHIMCKVYGLSDIDSLLHTEYFEIGESLLQTALPHEYN